MSKWFDENLHYGFRISLEANELIHSENTGLQDLLIFRNPFFGKVLMLDGIIQLTEADEFIYHESLSHIALFAHGNIKKALVIGGGDGGTAREILKHKCIEHLTVVEIDAKVVEFSQKYLPTICKNVFDEPRLTLVIDDGVKFLKSQETFNYDLIIIDSTDPLGPAEPLFSEDFYKSCKKSLNEGGILVTQNGVPFLQKSELQSSISILKSLFSDSTCFLATVPTYAGGPMAFGWGTDNNKLRKNSIHLIEKRFKEAALMLRYYNPSLHSSAFVLPTYIETIIKD